MADEVPLPPAEEEGGEGLGDDAGFAGGAIDWQTVNPAFRELCNDLATKLEGKALHPRRKTFASRSRHVPASPSRSSRAASPDGEPAPPHVKFPDIGFPVSSPLTLQSRQQSPGRTIRPGQHLSPAQVAATSGAVCSRSAQNLLGDEVEEEFLALLRLSEETCAKNAFWEKKREERIFGQKFEADQNFAAQTFGKLHAETEGKFLKNVVGDRGSRVEERFLDKLGASSPPAKVSSSFAPAKVPGLASAGAVGEQVEEHFLNQFCSPTKNVADSGVEDDFLARLGKGHEMLGTTAFEETRASGGERKNFSTAALGGTILSDGFSPWKRPSLSSTASGARPSLSLHVCSPVKIGPAEVQAPPLGLPPYSRGTDVLLSRSASSLAILATGGTAGGVGVASAAASSRSAGSCDRSTGSINGPAAPGFGTRTFLGWSRDDLGMIAPVAAMAAPIAVSHDRPLQEPQSSVPPRAEIVPPSRTSTAAPDAALGKRSLRASTPLLDFMRNERIRWKYPYVDARDIWSSASSGASSSGAWPRSYAGGAGAPPGAAQESGAVPRALGGVEYNNGARQEASSSGVGGEPPRRNSFLGMSLEEYGTAPEAADAVPGGTTGLREGGAHSAAGEDSDVGGLSAAGPGEGLHQRTVHHQGEDQVHHQGRDGGRAGTGPSNEEEDDAEVAVLMQRTKFGDGGGTGDGGTGDDGV